LNHLETSVANAFCLAIDSVSALVILAYCAIAFITAVRSGSPAEAHSLVARGALLGMSIKLVGTCLKTIQLQTWNQIGLFLVIFALRVILKRIFQAEAKISAR
jgi:hypothetical protein